MQRGCSAVDSAMVSKTYWTWKTYHLLIRVVSSETIPRLTKHFQPCIMKAFQICIYAPPLYDDPLLIFKVRRNETICCLIGFGIGVGCCLLYKLISNFLTPEHKNSKQRDAQTMGQEQSYSSEIAVSYSKRPRPRTTDNTSHPVAISKHEQHREERIVCDRCRHQASEQENDCEPLVGLPITKYHHEHYELKSSNPMTWSEISSSDLLESYHSNSIGDSGIESNPTGSRSKLTTKNNKKKENMNSTLNNYGYELNSTYDEYDQIFPSASSANVLGTNRKYDSDTAICQSTSMNRTQSVTMLTQCATDALQNNLMSYMTTEKGLERAIEHTTKLNQDLEMILTDFGTLSRRYSQSSVNKILTSTSSATYDNHHFQHSHTIDVLDWNYNDCSPMPQSPNSYRRQSSRNTNSSQTSNKSQNSRNKTKLKRRLNTMSSDYHESDETRSYDYTSSPLRRRPSSVYFDSSDTSDEDAPSDDILDTISSNCSSNQTNLDDTLNVEQNNDDETLSPVKMSTTTEFISCSNDSELSIETEDQNKYS